MSAAGRGRGGAGGAAPPRELAPLPPRGIDTSFELVAMETANGAGRRRGLNLLMPGGAWDCGIAGSHLVKPRTAYLGSTPLLNTTFIAFGLTFKLSG